ncbi:MAG: hypothetical protein GX557_03600 [Chloroflexi bacterium]|nr:hypothetical protein [Chloroflexota bacterium]
MGLSDVLRWLALLALGGLGVIAAVGRRRNEARATRSALSAGTLLALALQWGALLLHAAASQRLTGSYWRWTQGECWALTAWLVNAGVCVVVWQMDWRGRRAWASYCLACAVLLAVALLMPLVLI